MFNVLDVLYEIIFSGYFYFFIFMIFILFIFFMLYKKFDLIINLITNHSKLANNVEITPISKYKKLDNKYYAILYNVYNMIGSTLNAEKYRIFDEKYLLKLNEAKNIFYGIKRNKDLIKSNFLLLKILKKIRTYDISKNDIDDTIIYLIVVVLNKKNRFLI